MLPIKMKRPPRVTEHGITAAARVCLYRDVQNSVGNDDYENARDDQVKSTSLEKQCESRAASLVNETRSFVTSIRRDLGETV